MVRTKVSLPAKCEDFLKSLAQDHEIDLDTVLTELCEWAFNDPEGREQFKKWLDEAYPQKGEVEEESSAAEEDAAEEEEESEEETEEESHEHRD
jgi:metal-dependent amidase/aminoacylase/carboxypeptidase family protein